ncbi:hypothetical protein EHS25_001639 [Saitozyma podzolica]|uniref:FAD/NAD(P)-binding domain-containing protein n=1 Tax=Saitozyma podzolica TaxID=1890683 RepID=A0A427YGL8_9TREE|nr:hypothetical protein EHS25_001639 [Saitozyma podzolica]
MAALSVSMPLAPLPTDLPCHGQGFKPSGDAQHQVQSVAQHFLSTLERACIENDGGLFRSLFIEDGFWRDILAFTSDFRAIRTANIAHAANAVLRRTGARNFVFASTAPTIEHPYEDITFLTIHFEFETKLGPSYGVARLVWDDTVNEWRAFTLFTLLEGIHDYDAKVGAKRSRGTHNDRVSYDERRAHEQDYQDKQPDVLLVGGGHNGLAVAAQLKVLGLQALVIDKQERVGDNWRKRYRRITQVDSRSSLSLHDPVYANHLPFIPFPATWPTYTPAGKLANFLEYYADILELDVWLRSSLVPTETKFDESTKKWNVTIARGNEAGNVEFKRFSVKHIVLATGFGGGRPKMPPAFPGQDVWDGVAVHSSGHGTGSDWKGKKALVVGACTSGHDICVDFAPNGVDVTMLQRSPTFVMSVDKGQEMIVGGLYGPNGPTTHVADRIAESNPKFVAKLFHKRIIQDLKVHDGKLLDGLASKGFKTWQGPDDSGFLMMALSKAGGYYFSTGGSEMIADGQIKVRQGEISSFESGSLVRFKDGSEERFDVVVFATGYTGFPDCVRDTVGEKYAGTFNPVWGMDEEGEIKGVCRESGIPNLFFMVGALAGSRVMSKVLALQILAQQLGRLEEPYTYGKQAFEGGLADKSKVQTNGHVAVNGVA